MSATKDELAKMHGNLNAYRAQEILQRLSPVLSKLLDECKPGPERELLEELVDIVLMLGGAARESASSAAAMASSDVHISRIFR